MPDVSTRTKRAEVKAQRSAGRVLLIGYRRALVKKQPSVEKVFTRLLSAQTQNQRRGVLTVDDAIADLPRIEPNEGSDAWFGN